MAQAPHVPTDENRHIVEVLVAGGTPKRTIARALQIGLGTLKRHYAEELETGAEMANAKVVRRLFRLIEQGSTPATIFWLKARAGWKEGQTIAVEEAKPEVTYDFSHMSAQEKERLRATLVKIVRGSASTH